MIVLPAGGSLGSGSSIVPIGVRSSTCPLVPGPSTVAIICLGVAAPSATGAAGGPDWRDDCGVLATCSTASAAGAGVVKVSGGQISMIRTVSWLPSKSCVPLDVAGAADIAAAVPAPAGASGVRKTIAVTIVPVYSAISTADSTIPPASADAAAPFDAEAGPSAAADD